MTTPSVSRSTPPLLPATPSGRRAISLFAISIAAFAVFYLMIALGERGGETFTSNWLLTGPFLVAAGTGIAGAIAGLVGVIRERERAILVLIPIVFGALLGVFLAGEVVSPH